MTITNATYMIVFFVPMTPRITSMLGRDSDGPASNKANAGPFPIPDAINPCTIGTSVNVAKYMNAPEKLAKKFENNEVPPTAHSIHSFGMIPAMTVSSCVEPSRNPAVMTPMANNGMICFANPQADNVHSRFSGSRLSSRVITERDAIPTIIGTSGTIFGFGISQFAKTADNAVAATPAITHCHFIFNILISE